MRGGAAGGEEIPPGLANFFTHLLGGDAVDGMTYEELLER